jgi:hypothetical protein
VEQGEVVTGGLFVAGGEGAKAFELMEEQLDAEALAVQLAREWTAACFATGMLANDDLHTSLVELLNQFTAVVGGVREESPALRVLDELLGDGGFVTRFRPDLFRRKQTRQTFPLSVAERMSVHRPV